MESFACKVCSLVMGNEGRLPKVLGCGHTLCSVCVPRLVEHDFIECPHCEVNCFTRSADDIPINHMVNTILQSSFAGHLVAIANIIKEYEDQEPGQAASASKDDVPSKIHSTKKCATPPQPQAAAEACILKAATGSDPQKQKDPDKTESLKSPHHSKIVTVNVTQKEFPKLEFPQLASLNRTASEEPRLSKQNGNRSHTKAKQSEDSKESKQSEDSKESKQSEDSKESKQSEDSKESKQSEDSKESKQSEDSKESKQSEDSKESKQSEDSKESKQSEDSKESKQSKTSEQGRIEGSNKSDCIAEEPDYHAGKCETHQKYKTFYCIKCIQWTCFSCIKIYHPQKTCITTTLRQGRELMRHLETEEIAKILKEFEDDINFLRKRNRTVRKLICQFKKQILELRILLNHCEKAEKKLVLEVFDMNSVIADGLDSVFMLLTAQRILLDDSYAEELIGKARSVDDYMRIRQQWFGPSNFENSSVIKHAMELQKALEASFKVFRGFQQNFVHGNFSFTPPEKAREKLTVLAAQILGGSRAGTMGSAGDRSVPSAAGSTTETASTAGSTTETASAAGSTTETASAAGSTTETASAAGSTTETASGAGSTSDIASAVSKETLSTTESTSGSGSKKVEEPTGESRISEDSLFVSEYGQQSADLSQSTETYDKETSQTSSSIENPVALSDLFEGIRLEVILGEDTPTEDEQESITSEVD
ncbi:uncharacterized protein LOC135213062 isoform X2 [Macrobrachium nipponense]|uniref:uncharacterized protein LOC135213062 isoform X2 n=1 Tax=Macrobrachium nipponense TaxID=159736 RepID=UPI0030C85F7C